MKTHFFILAAATLLVSGGLASAQMQYNSLRLAHTGTEPKRFSQRDRTERSEHWWCFEQHKGYKG